MKRKQQVNEMRMEGMRKFFCSTPLHCTYPAPRMAIRIQDDCMAVKIYTTRIRPRSLSMYSIHPLAVEKKIQIRKAANIPLINGHKKGNGYASNCCGKA